MTLTIHPSRRIDEAAAVRLTGLWNAAYPGMREVLDAVIRANRGTAHPRVDVRGLETVRRELGQVDRGTHRPCTRSEPAFSPHIALSLVRAVIDVVPLGSPHAGGIYRLAAELADVTTRPAATTRSAA